MSNPEIKFNEWLEAWFENGHPKDKSGLYTWTEIKEAFMAGMAYNTVNIIQTAPSSLQSQSAMICDHDYHSENMTDFIGTRCRKCGKILE